MNIVFDLCLPLFWSGEEEADLTCEDPCSGAEVHNCQELRSRNLCTWCPSCHPTLESSWKTLEVQIMKENLCDLPEMENDCLNMCLLKAEITLLLNFAQCLQIY